MNLQELGWPAVVALVAVLVTVIAYLIWGIVALYSWPVQVVGLACVALSIRRSRRWWLLATMPILAGPLALWCLLLYEISQGRFP